MLLKSYIYFSAIMMFNIDDEDKKNPIEGIIEVFKFLYEVICIIAKAFLDLFT